MRSSVGGNFCIFINITIKAKLIRVTFAFRQFDHDILGQVNGGKVLQLSEDETMGSFFKAVCQGYCVSYYHLKYLHRLGIHDKLSSIETCSYQTWHPRVFTWLLIYHWTMINCPPVKLTDLFRLRAWTPWRGAFARIVNRRWLALLAFVVSGRLHRLFSLHFIALLNFDLHLWNALLV